MENDERENIEKGMKGRVHWIRTVLLKILLMKFSNLTPMVVLKIRDDFLRLLIVGE